MKPMVCRLLGRTLPGAGVVFAALWLVTAPAPAQDKGRLNPAKNFQAEPSAFALYRKMRNGDVDAEDAVLDQGAQWYMYRFTFKEFQEPQSTVNPTTMFTLMQNALLELPLQRKPANAKAAAAAEKFCKALVVHGKRVLGTDKVIARLNATMLLGEVARTGLAEEVNDVLAETLKKAEEHDAVKFYACQGLKNAFTVAQDPQNPLPFKDREREKRCTQALIDYIVKGPKLATGALPEEVAAARYVRREAIEALGKTRYPAHAKVELGQLKSVEVPTALTLLKVIARDGLTPEPGVAEIAEAAVGLCQLQSDLMRHYNADYVAYYIGRAVYEVGSAKLKEQDSKRSTEPWKVHGAKLTKAFADFRADVAKLQAVQAYTNKLAPEIGQILGDLERGTVPTSLARLRSVLDTPPASTTVYRGIESSSVKPPKDKTDDMN